MFSPLGPDQTVQVEIAQAFWSLLLTNPDDVADFEAVVYHSGASVWLLYACQDGEFLFGETEDPGGDYL